MVFGRARAAVNADSWLNGAQFFAGFDKFGNNLQYMIRLARLNIAAGFIGQHGFGQFFEQAHGFSFVFFMCSIVTRKGRAV